MGNMVCVLVWEESKHKCLNENDLVNPPSSSLSFYHCIANLLNPLLTPNVSLTLHSINYYYYYHYYHYYYYYSVFTFQLLATSSPSLSTLSPLTLTFRGLPHFFLFSIFSCNHSAFFKWIFIWGFFFHKF